MKITCYVHHLASLVVQGNTHFVLEGDIYSDYANLSWFKHRNVTRLVLSSASCSLELNAHLALLAHRPTTMHREVRDGMDPLYLVAVEHEGVATFDLYHPPSQVSESQE